MVTDTVLSDPRPDRGHDTGEISAQPRQVPFEARVAPERDEDVGEVDAGCGDRDLDRSRSWRNPVERNEFHGLQVTRSADLHAHTVVLVFDDGRSPFARAQRTGPQACGVPIAIAPGGLVFVGPTEKLQRQLLRSVPIVVPVDLGGAQVRMLGIDHPHQATQSGLLQVGQIAVQTLAALLVTA